MKKPTRYYVEWNASEDEYPKMEHEDVEGYGEASYLAALQRARVLSEKLGLTVFVLERTKIEDVTPEGDPPGTLWDFEAEFVADVTI